jgi:inorganic triphosphatase YgiF
MGVDRVGEDGSMVDTPVGLTPESPVGELVTTAMAKGSTRLQKAVTMVEASEDDGIHQVRVACRRLRSDLRLFRKLLASDWARHLRAELTLILVGSADRVVDIRCLRPRLWSPVVVAGRVGLPGATRVG